MDFISKKIKMKIENISYLQSELKNNFRLSEEDILDLLKRFEKTTRDEMSCYFESYFTDGDFATVLLQIARNYKENKKVQIYVLSSLGNMINRYHLKETKEIYEYFRNARFTKGISAYVSIYFPHFKRFQEEENKWDYFMKIAKMTPKKIAEINFLAILNEYIEEIPSEYKQEIIDFLQEKYQMANNEGGKKYYQDMINRMNFNF